MLRGDAPSRSPFKLPVQKASDKSGPGFRDKPGGIGGVEMGPRPVGGGNTPVYEIWSRSQGKPVATVTTREGATRAVDRRDTARGSNDHYWKLK